MLPSDGWQAISIAVDSGPPPERPAGAAGSAVPALFQRAGSILALGPVMSFSGERTLDSRRDPRPGDDATA